MKKNQRVLLLMLSVVMMVLSCTKTEITTSKTSHPEKVLSYIKSLGYPETSIVEEGEAYIVEGDIAFRKNMILPEDTGRSATVEQYFNGTLVNLAHQVIGIRIDPSLAVQTAEVNAAVALWNNAHSWVVFQVVTSGGQILIRNTNLGIGFCGRGDAPAGGLPGAIIDINVGQVAGDNFNQRMINIAHEMGHTIGFRHTNGDGGIFATPVPGWGGTDANSIMNGMMCHTLPTVLSYKDINAVNALYPNPYIKNSRIDIAYGDFTIRWDLVTPNPSDNLTGYQVTYSGMSGIGFSGTVNLSVGTSYYTIPGVTSNPTSGNTQSGYIGATIKALYGSAIYASNAPSRSKVNGVWQ